MKMSDIIAILIATLAFGFMGEFFGFERVIISLLVYILYEIYVRDKKEME